MTSFSFIFILAFIIGLIRYKPKDDNLWTLFIALKGFFALYLAGIINNTGLSLLIAALGVTIGHQLINKIKGTGTYISNTGGTEFLFTGILLRFSPLMTGVCLLFFMTLYYLTKKKQLSILLASVILLISLYLLRRPDSLIILGFFILIHTFLQFIVHLEKNKSYNTRLAEKSFYLKALTVIAIIAIGILLFFNRYVYRGFGLQEDIIRNGPREFNYLALTFDDGPDPAYTPEILDILQEKGVKATFFLVGRNAERYPEIVKKITEEGHSIGNHTYSHRSLIPLSRENTRYEILAGEKIINEITGEKPTLFRPPRGVYSQYAREFLIDNRYTMVLWDVSSQDWRELRYNNIITNILNGVENGSIILFHDSGDIFTSSGGNRINTVKSLPQIIEQLRAREYEFVTIDQLIILKGLAENEEDIEGVKEMFLGGDDDEGSGEIGEGEDY